MGERAPDRHTVTVTNDLILLHNERMGLEKENGLVTDVWHMLASLREFCRYHILDPDAIWAEVLQHEAETDCASQAAALTSVPMTTDEIAAIDLLIELELGASESDRIEGWEHLETLADKLPPPPAGPVAA